MVSQTLRDDEEGLVIMQTGAEALIEKGDLMTLGSNSASR
jgi:hypothetical protein